MKAKLAAASLALFFAVVTGCRTASVTEEGVSTSSAEGSSRAAQEEKSLGSTADAVSPTHATASQASNGTPQPAAHREAGSSWTLLPVRRLGLTVTDDGRVLVRAAALAPAPGWEIELRARETGDPTPLFFDYDLFGRPKSGSTSERSEPTEVELEVPLTVPTSVLTIIVNGSEGSLIEGVPVPVEQEVPGQDASEEGPSSDEDDSFEGETPR